MSCHICGREAIDRCYTCGQLFCAEHGHVNCVRCETGIAAGDLRADRISSTLLRDQRSGRAAWWRAQEAEDYEPPSCHICRGLTRLVCKNCDKHYCPEHAGPPGICRECGRSSLMGIWCMLAGLAVMGGILTWGYLSEALGPLAPDQRRSLGLLIFGVLLGAAAYLVVTVSCMTLFRKAGKQGWAAFVPVWNLLVLLQIAGKPSWWLALYLLSTLLFGLPILALQVFVGIGLAKNFGRSQEFGVGLGLLPVVFLPILACSDDAAYAPARPDGTSS